MHDLKLKKRVPAAPILSDIAQVCDAPLAREAVVPVRTARVVIADYAALFHDFPQVFGQEDFWRDHAPHFCERCVRSGKRCLLAVDRWIVEHAAYVSARQAEPNVVNSAIDHGAPVQLAYRPPRYGRALVLPVPGSATAGRAQLLDVKGAGVAADRTPSHQPHSSGLEYVGVALADFFYGWLIDRIFARTVPGYGVAPVYAVLDLGFDIVNGWHGSGPAGLHVRRAHARATGGITTPLFGSQEEMVQLHIELLLRSFGMTSAAAGTSFEVIDGVLHYSGQPLPIENERQQRKAEEIAQVVAPTRLERLNIQTTRGASWEPKSAQLVDFGHIHSRKRFQHALAGSARDGVWRLGRIIRRNDAAFVQPDPRLAVDVDVSNRSNVNAHGFYIAQCFRDNRMDRAEVANRLRRALTRALRPNRR